MEENVQNNVQETTPVESTEAVEAVETTQEAEGTQETQKDAQPDVDYSSFLETINGKPVFLGEPMTFDSFDDVVNRLQKSENYDRMEAKYQKQLEAANNRPELKFLENFLHENGYETFEDYQTALEVDKLTSEGMSKERALEYIEGQRAKEAQKQAAERAAFEEQKKNVDTDNHAEAIKWYKEKGYGELSAEKITEETWAKVEKGLPLKYALMEQMFDHVKGDTEQEVLRKLKEQGESAMPAANSTAETQKKSYLKMSREEFAKEKAKVLGRSTW